MCGRFAFYSPHEAVVRLFGVADAPPVEPRYNIAPTQFIAAVRANHAGDRSLAMLHWGLVPSWAREKSIGARMINARAETLGEKPSFRSAYRRRRCLVLANGWYEWQRSGSVKQPFYLSFSDREPFGMAGLWESWRDPESGELLESCCIVTVPAAPELEHVHHRMPAIIAEAQRDEWLQTTDGAAAAPGGLLVPWAHGGLEVRPVSRRVNDARNQGADLVEPLGMPADPA
jgi:putative SOS response-associated peptidase YedK